MDDFQQILRKPNNIELIKTFTNHPNQWMNIKILCHLNNKPYNANSYRANLIQLQQENVLKRKQVKKSGRANPEMRYKLNTSSNKPKKLLERIKSRASDSN